MEVIGGVFFRDDSIVDRNQLVKMVNLLTHRSGHQRTTFCRNSVGLFNLRKPSSFQVESPISYEGLVVFSNARIDNTLDLQTSLGFSSSSKIEKNELFARAYLKWGDSFGNQLLGVFTIVIWDQVKEELFMLCDQIGIRSLFYYIDDKKLVFCNEINALRQFVSFQINRSQIPYYLTYTDRAGERIETLIKNVYLFARGKSMKVSNHKVQSSIYYRLIEHVDNSGANYSDEEYGLIFHEKFRKAVRRRLEGSSYIGAELSGGLDSSYICAMAGNIYGASYSLPVYHIKPEGNGTDESSFAKLVARHSQLQYNEVRAHSTFRDLSYYSEILGLPIEQYHTGVTVSYTHLTLPTTPYV